MKNLNLKYVVSFIVISILITGCADKLDKLPPQAVSTEIGLINDANVKQVLVGAYDGLSDYYLFGGLILRNSELLAADGEIYFSGTYEQPGEILLKEITTTNSDVEYTWINAYNVINIANNVLSALDVIETPEDRDRVEGEAKFLRGLVYFELVKYFAQPYSAGNTTGNLGVPIITTPTTAVNEASKVARNTVEEVYTQVLSDLSDAAGLLPAYNDEYATSVAANAVLSRVYLQMQDYTNARTAANTALTEAATDYAMLSSYDAVFNRDANSTEDIFAIQVTKSDGYNSMQEFYASTINQGRGDMDILQSHLDFYSPGDVRGAFYYTDGSKNRTNKWIDYWVNVNTIRLAELYLTRAECNVRLGGSVGDTPQNDLDRTRSRAGLPTIAAPTLNDVLLERKLEFAHEGHAIHDFKRTKGDSYRLSDQNAVVGDGLVDGFAYDADELVYPIPDREIKVNTNLVQNPGYGG